MQTGRKRFFLTYGALPALVVAALLGMLLVSPAGLVQAASPPASAPDRVTCEGYPEPRVYMESVAWWQPTISGTEDFGHVHGGACFPRTHRPDGTVNAISGKLQLDVRVVMFENPGRLRFVRVYQADKAGQQHLGRVWIDETCEQGGPRWVDALHGCEWWVSVEVDTTEAAYDGFQEFRIGAVVRQKVGTDDSMFSSTGWQAYLDNGKPVKHYRANSDGSPRHFTEARGWYDGARYAQARLESPLPYEVSGTWTPTVRMRPGSDSAAVRRSVATIDSNLHSGDPGRMLLDHAGEYWGPLTIDTTTLADGPHRLFLRAHAPCDGTAGNDCGLKVDGSSMNVSTNTGVLIVNFVVRNGSEPPPTEPPPTEPPTTEPPPTEPHPTEPPPAEPRPTEPPPAEPPPHDDDVVVVVPTQDATVDARNPAQNDGSGTDLLVREGRNGYFCLLQFEVADLDEAPTSATLRLFVTSQAQDGGDLQVVDNAWDESTVTWDSAPARSGSVIASTGRTSAGAWIELDVTAAIGGNGVYSFALTAKAGKLAAYSSREGAHPPELVLRR